MKRILILSLAFLAASCSEHATGVMQGYGEANERDSVREREDRVNGYVTGEDSVSACPACS